MARYPDNYKQAAMIPLLDLAQRQCGGWLPLGTVPYMLCYSTCYMFRVTWYLSYYSTCYIIERFPFSNLFLLFAFLRFFIQLVCLVLFYSHSIRYFYFLTFSLMIWTFSPPSPSHSIMSHLIIFNPITHLLLLIQHTYIVILVHTYTSA
jgi:hypothetical protein